MNEKLYSRREISSQMLIASMLSFAACRTRSTSNPLTLYAASSMILVLQNVLHEFESTFHITVRCSFEASNQLAWQIEAGARADLMISADPTVFDTLQKKGFIYAQDRHFLARNQLVIVSPIRSNITFQNLSSLLDSRKIATGNPTHVPLGLYVKRWLEKQNLWSIVNMHMIPTLDARAALAAVETGVVDLAIVYRTDALSSRQVRVVYEVPVSETPDIVYQMASLARSTHTYNKQCIDFLRSERVHKEFLKQGFLEPA